MRFDQLTRTTKWKDVLADNSQVIFLEGPSQTSKTTLESVKIIWDLAKNCPYGETIVFLCGESTNTLYRNFIEKDVGVTKLFPFMTKYVGDSKRGGERIEVLIPYIINGEKVYETKKIFLVGYTTVNSENKLLGGKPYMIICDEMNKAHEGFVKQVFTRITATGCKLLATTNGDAPDKLFYQYLNTCRPTEKYLKDVPASTMQDMLEVTEKKGWTYYFFGLEDRPNVTREWILGMYGMHPIGSFSYNAFVLGIRGATDGVLYGHLLKNSHVVAQDNINFGAIIDVCIGIDVGSGGTVEGNARTVVTMAGFSRGYQRVIVIDAILSKNVEHLKLIEEVDKWLNEWLRVFGYKVRGIWIDSADRTLIETFRKNKKTNVDILGSVKSTKEITAFTRVSLKEQLIMHDRLLFNNTEGAQMVKTQLAKVKGNNGETLDENMLHNDVNDSLDYSLTPRFKQLLTARLM